jgi:hypothetical protein
VNPAEMICHRTTAYGVSSDFARLDTGLGCRENGVAACRAASAALRYRVAALEGRAFGGFSTGPRAANEVSKSGTRYRSQ